jgi:CRP/FNR family cyclic AMP-dependent transcriptional regulator
MTLESLRAFALNLPWFDYIGYLGMLLGLVSMAMRTIIPLRLFAIGACVCLGTFALLREAWPTLVVNACTIPVLAWRTREMVMLTRRTSAAAQSSAISVDWLLPFMHPRPIRAGETLFKKGDDAGEMFYICSGRLKLVEYDVALGPGEVVGEIAMFSPTRTRTRTIVAETDCELMAIGESEIKQLYYQNPRFGFYLIQLITRRLVTNMERLEATVAEQRTAMPTPVVVVPAKAGTHDAAGTA